MSKNHVKGIIFDIMRYAIHDGPGIRTTVFLKGCPLKCWWCQNPEGISRSKDLLYIEYKCIDCRTCINVCPTNAITLKENKHTITRTVCTRCGACTEACPTGALKLVGHEIDVEELMREIEKDVLLHDSSEGGVTFSGGEPLSQPSFLRETLKQCKKRGIHTVLDTSGYASPKIFDPIVKHVDLFLYDIKLLDNEKHQKYTEVSNKVIKKNLRTLAKNGRGRDVIIRFPVIPRITDTEKNVNEILSFVSRLKGINEIDILPFHDVSEKYSRLGKENEMKIHTAPSEEKLKYIKEKFERKGLQVKVGG